MDTLPIKQCVQTPPCNYSTYLSKIFYHVIPSGATYLLILLIKCLYVNGILRTGYPGEEIIIFYYKIIGIRQEVEGFPSTAWYF